MEFFTLQDFRGCRARRSISPTHLAELTGSILEGGASARIAARAAGRAAGLLSRLSQIPDHRDPRRVRYPQATLLAIGVCAMTAPGHNSLVTVAEWAHRIGDAVLARLGVPLRPVHRTGPHPEQAHPAGDLQQFRIRTCREG